MHRGQGIEEQAAAGRVDAQGVAVEGDRGRLVQRHPLRHAVAEPLPAAAQYSANRYAVVRFIQPPRCSRGSGVSQWYRVAMGEMPAASKPVDQPVVEVQARAR